MMATLGAAPAGGNPEGEGGNHAGAAWTGRATPGGADPLILCARFDPVGAAVFARLRDRHFPPRLNIVPAHCTLFHHLPGNDLPAIAAQLAAVAAATAPVPFATGGLRFLGRGVAFDIDAPPLLALRKTLAETWAAVLTPQDRQGFRPHVTVQNKAEPAAARALRDRLMADWTPVSGTIEGLDLWHYRGGPWEIAARFSFGPPP